jgi:hypothetical protein
MADDETLLTSQKDKRRRGHGTESIRHALTFDEHNVNGRGKKKTFDFRAIEFPYQLIPKLQRKRETLSSLLGAGFNEDTPFGLVYMSRTSSFQLLYCVHASYSNQ